MLEFGCVLVMSGVVDQLHAIMQYIFKQKHKSYVLRIEIYKFCTLKLYSMRAK